MKALKRIVMRKVGVMFPNPALRTRIEKELQRYGDDDEPQVERVRLAILKLCAGDPDKINIAGAKEDPQAIIEGAEHPERMDAAIKNRKLRPEEEEMIEARDWEQYHEWLSEGLK